jgi:hypothetical protein
MPFNSSIYTDLELPSLNQDNSTYGTIINTYFQALETKLKNLSDRINAAGVGDSSTLAQINSDIDGILPDPYSGDYTTVSTWPAYNTELTALGLSPPETASEINTFFDSGDFATFASFLNGKLDSIDTILATAESDIDDAQTDICKANLYSDKINDVDIEWELQTTYNLEWDVFNVSVATSGTALGNASSNPAVLRSPYSKPPQGTTVTVVSGTPSLTGKGLSDLGTIFYTVEPSVSNSGSLTVNSSFVINPDAAVETFSSLYLSSGISVAGSGYWYGVESVQAAGSYYYYAMTVKKYKLIITTPDTSGC